MSYSVWLSTRLAKNLSNKFKLIRKHSVIDAGRAVYDTDLNTMDLLDKTYRLWAKSSYRGSLSWDDFCSKVLLDGETDNA